MFITFEGIEGSGKSTLLSHAQIWLEKQNYDFIMTREPGGSELGKKIRSILLSLEHDVLPHAELFLYLADRAQHVGLLVKPALEEGKIVISDRYADSCIVYQGYGRGLDIEELLSFNNVAVQGIWPDLSFVLDLSPELGLERARKRNRELGLEITEGRFEAEAMNFHKTIRQGYLDWAKRFPERFCIVNAEKSPEDLAAEVCGIMAERLIRK